MRDSHSFIFSLSFKEITLQNMPPEFINSLKAIKKKDHHGGQLALI